MSVPIPPELYKEIFRTSMRMPQAVLPIPPGYEVTIKLTPPSPGAVGWVFVGFSFGGHLADGSRIPGYDFVKNKGITWRATYVNKSPLETIESKTYYLTDDYLYQQIVYGPRPVTEYMEVTVGNTLDQLVYLSQTAYLYELPLDKIMKLFGK